MQTIIPQGSPSPFLHRRRAENGLALVVVLFAVALVSIVVLAYFNLALMNRTISFSSAGEARANIVALSALNFIKGDFISEIQAGSIAETDPNGSGVPIYLPATNATMLPYRMTTNVAFSSSMPANLIKWSSGSVAFWTNTPSYANTTGPKRGVTGISTANASVNGHYIGGSRWTKPDFGTSSTLPSTVVPEWAFLTRAGPLTNTATPISLLANSTATNSSYVIGRYAYVVYDEGGLLDITAAGYSPGGFATYPTDVGRKGSQAFADLTKVGLTTTQIEALGAWRNASSWSSSSATAYTNFLQTNAAATGFLQPAAGDQTFLSRQDLISYWTSQMSSAPIGLLTNFTTFSREKNAPSWGPEHDANDTANITYWNGSNTDTAFDGVTYNDPAGGISYTYRTSQDSAAANNRFFPNVRVKNAFTRLSNEQAVTGEPLVKNRFDLSKLAWISYTGKTPSGVSYQDIYNYFGLVANFTGGVFQNWTYDHSYKVLPTSATVNSTTSMIHIKTLDEVASLAGALAREPDFFELLQAGILRGSLGLVSGDPAQATINNSDLATGGEFFRAAIATPTFPPIDMGAAAYRPMANDGSSVPKVVNAQPMYQVIQIGANMIDQTDTDNYPTEIILNQDHFYGIENLPYINAIGDAALRLSPSSTALTSTTDNTLGATAANQSYVHRWLDFGLWNPHQNAKTPPSLGPTNIRISVCGLPSLPCTEYPYVQGLGTQPGPSISGGIDYSGRSFEVPGSPIGTPSAGSPALADGPAWIGLKLSDYTNFYEASTIDYGRSYTSDGTPNINDPDGRVQTSGAGNSAYTWQRAGIYLGWSKSPDNPWAVPESTNIWPNYLTRTTNAAGATCPTLANHALMLQWGPVYFTIDLQYQDAAGTWRTYEEIHNLDHMRGTVGGSAWMEQNDPGWANWTTDPSGPTVSPSWYTNTVAQSMTSTSPSTVPAAYNGSIRTNMDNVVISPFDPRTTRLNFWTQRNSPLYWGGGTGLDQTVGTTWGYVNPSKGMATGPHFVDPSGALPSWNTFCRTWVDNISIAPMANKDNTGTTTYYRDRDFIARVGDAAGWTNVVLPSDATSVTNNASPLTTGAVMQRSLHLDRPFRNVGELGYVFRDDPWKTLNLVSANSADAGLLDTFYIGPVTNSANPTAPSPDVLAAKMNINSAALNVIASGSSPATSPVLQALISQALRDYKSASGTPSVIDTGITAPTDIQALSTNIVNYVKVNGPFTSIADVPKVFPQVTATTGNYLYTGLKNPSEGLVRSLTDSSGTRTWDLMIDVVAQAGKFSPTAANMNNFTVEGEKHYWLHVAIDRFTGEIVDQQLEPVWE
jgi:Tfp pilus assembly protein PilX